MPSGPVGFDGFASAAGSLAQLRYLFRRRHRPLAGVVDAKLQPIAVTDQPVMSLAFGLVDKIDSRQVRVWGS